MKRNKAHIAKTLGLFGSLILLSSCEEWSLSGLKNDEQSNGEPIARVYDSYLYRSDVKDLVPANTDSIDSASFVQNFITLWAKDQLMVYKAEYNLSAENKNFEEQIEKYRKDLLTFAYQKQYIAERLDTNMNEQEIRAYYEAHKDNFLLKENILKVAFVILPENAPKRKSAEKWFKSGKEEDAQKLKSYAQKYAREFAIEDTNWISFDALTNTIPLETYNQIEFLNRNKTVVIEQGGMVYLLRIKKYKIADSSSPLPYVRDVIKSILLNRRKQALIEELQKNLLEDALDKNEFETY